MLVVTRMARDLDIPVEVVPVETVREADGLAMSSRNAYLSDVHRTVAPVIYKTIVTWRPPSARAKPRPLPRRMVSKP